jgi:hypothetical protein
VLHRRGFVALRNSPKTIELLEEWAREIAQRAGEGFATRPAETGQNRARVAVVTDDFKGRVREAKDRALTRAVGR